MNTPEPPNKVVWIGLLLNLLANCDQLSPRAKALGRWVASGAVGGWQWTVPHAVGGWHWMATPRGLATLLIANIVLLCWAIGRKRV